MKVMEDPAMKEMAMKMMGKFMGGGASEGSTGAPDLSNLMNMGQQFAQQMSEDHPEVVERLRQQMGSSDNQNQPKTE